MNGGKRMNHMLSNPDTYKNWTMPIVGQAVTLPDKSCDLMDELKVLKQEAYKEAYQAGLDQAQAEINQLTHKLESAIHLLIAPLEMVDEMVKNTLTECVVLLTQQCLLAELSIDKQKIVNIVNAMIAALDEKNLATKVYLSQQDLSAIQSLTCEKLASDLIQFEIDPKLTVGEVRIETPHCTIDGTVQNRLRTICNDILLQPESTTS